MSEFCAYILIDLKFSVIGISFYSVLPNSTYFKKIMRNRKRVDIIVGHAEFLLALCFQQSRGPSVTSTLLMYY